MAGKRATQFAETMKRLRTELKLDKATILGYMSTSSEVPGWMNSKARRMIARAEKKAEAAR